MAAGKTEVTADHAEDELCCNLQQAMTGHYGNLPES